MRDKTRREKVKDPETDYYGKLFEAVFLNEFMKKLAGNKLSLSIKLSVFTLYLVWVFIKVVCLFFCI
jgi:hypothetical protein